MGLTHLDAGVVIGLLESHDAHHAAATAALREVLERGHQLEMAASAFGECLVGPSRRGPSAVAVVLDLVKRLPISVVAIDSDIAAAAAVLRAKHTPLRLPDALVIATASQRSADQLLTTDRRWPTAKAMRVKTAIIGL